MKLIYIANARIPSERAHGKQIFKTCEALGKITSLELWLPARPQLREFKNVNPFDYYQSKKNFKIRSFWTIDFLNYINRLPNFIRILFFFLEEITFLASLSFSLTGVPLIYTRSLSVALLAKMCFKTHAFYEIHQLGRGSLRNHLYARVLNTLDGVVAISKGLQEDIGKLGVRNTTVVPDAVDLTDYQINKKSPPLVGQRVVYTGGLEESKGIFTLLGAARLLKPTKFEFVIAGGTYTLGDDVRFTDFIKKNQLTNVRYMGILPPSQIPDLLASARILVLPSSAGTVVGRKYTSPMKLFEYLASGRPIIATSTPANAEILTHQKTAFLVSPDNSALLADAIKSLSNNPHLLKLLATNASKLARKFSWNSRARKLLSFMSVGLSS